MTHDKIQRQRTPLRVQNRIQIQVHPTMLVEITRVTKFEYYFAEFRLNGALNYIQLDTLVKSYARRSYKCADQNMTSSRLKKLKKNIYAKYLK